MLFPVDNEARQIKELNGIWKFKRDNYYKRPKNILRTFRLERQ